MSFKCTEDVTIWLPHDMDQDLRRAANEAGCGVSEFLRDMVCMHLNGLTFGELVANSRRAALQSKAANATMQSPQARPANSQAQSA
jgi:hypothetical protein